MKGLFIVSISALLLIGGIYFFSWMGKNDYEVQLRENIVSQQEVCKANFDKMFKTIAQTAQVPSEYMDKSKEAFKEIYQPLIQDRYQDKDGNQQQVLMKWVQESNPQFDMAAASSLYAKIQTVIEVNRNEFFNQQRKLISFHQQHSVFCKTFMNKNLFFMGDRTILKCEEVGDESTEFCVQIIKSLNTENTYMTGQENDINIFNR